MHIRIPLTFTEALADEKVCLLPQFVTLRDEGGELVLALQRVLGDEADRGQAGRRPVDPALSATRVPA